MSIKSAIISLPDDRTETGLPAPMMLRNIAGSPLLSWMVRLMRDSGYARFLLLCDDEFTDAASACFPDGSLVSAGNMPSTAVLKEFLQTSADNLLYVTSPALIGGQALEAAVAQLEEDGADISGGIGSYTVDPESIASVMDAANFDLTRFVSVLGTELTEANGALKIEDPGTLADVQQTFVRLRNYYLYADGVEIWDFDSAYVSPLSEVAPGAVLMPGTILKGRSSVASGAVIGPNSLLENSIVEEGATINASQVYDSVITKGTNIGPFTCIRAN